MLGVRACRNNSQVIRQQSTAISKLAGVARHTYASAARLSIMDSRTSHAELISEFREIIPKLDVDAYKGQHGKVAVVGGCAEYTGAPYFAGISALKVGADMSYVVCTPSAATAVKSYSAELMVLPYLPEELTWPRANSADHEVIAATSVQRIMPWLEKATVVVVGPGLGDDPRACATVERVIKAVRQANTPLLVDGSALTNLIAKKPELVRGYQRCVLTPNIAELGRIGKAAGVEMPGKMSTEWLQHAHDIAKAYQGPVVVAKGPLDVITDGTTSVSCTQPAAPRRCGGQGDVLAGTMAAFMSWSAKRDLESLDTHGQDSGHGVSPLMLCAYAASAVMRRASTAAFDRQERSMVAGDVITSLYPAFKEVFGTR